MRRALVGLTILGVAVTGCSTGGSAGSSCKEGMTLASEMLGEQTAAIKHYVNAMAMAGKIGDSDYSLATIQNEMGYGTEIVQGLAPKLDRFNALKAQCQ